MKTLRSNQTGVSLLEVLIAVVILSLGILGLAGLQMSALRNNQSAMERSLAVMESYSIADAMRVDRSNAVAGAFNLSIEDETPSGGTFANNELAKWRTRLANSLGPGASGAIACNNTSCSITIRWDDRRGTGGSQQQQITTQALL